MSATWGLVIEAGAFNDMVKRFLFYGADFNQEQARRRVAKLWNILRALAYADGYSLEAILDRNISKLVKRYPDKFTKLHALKPRPGRRAEGAKRRFAGYPGAWRGGAQLSRDRPMENKATALSRRTRPLNSASNLHQRQLCPGSAWAEFDLDEQANADAREGTLLHWKEAHPRPTAAT